jgi:hypothetical protein
MAAGEDQLQPLVRNRHVQVHLVLNGFRDVEQLGLLDEGAVPADPVDRPVASRGDEPGSRVVGRAVPRPALGGDRERLLSGLLGQLEAAEEADQGGEDTTPFVAEDLLENR